MMTAQFVRASVGDIPLTGSYELDPARSTIEFRTRHLFGLGRVTGSFGLSDGVLDVADPPTKSLAQARIPVASVQSGNSSRDEAIRSRRLLDERSHPYLLFRSEGLSFGPEGWVVAGRLTVGEATSSLEVRVVELSVDDRELRLTAVAAVDRYAFGVTGMRGLAARRLELRCRIIAHRA
jgi:polyisoprenoid-binding protein YceI